MNDHEIKAALDDLVGRPPIVLGRRGAVMSRIATVQRRRKAAVQAALSAVLVLSAAGVATRVINATPTGSDRMVEQPSPSATPKAEPTHEPKPTVKPTEQPKPTVAAEPKPTEAPKPEPSHEPKPVTEPTHAPPAGLTVALYPYTDGPKAGSEMQWKVKAYDGAGRLLRIELAFGDGTKLVYEPTEPCGSGVALAKLVGHTYKEAGTYGARLSITTGGCDAETQTRVAESSVTVKPGATPEPTNGPATPTVTAEQVAGEIAKVALYGADSDGWVKKFFLNWGDGTESYVGPKSLDGCTNAEGTTHPKASSWDPQATHSYATPGTYTVKVYVMSTSCTGSAPQYGSVTISVTV